MKRFKVMSINKDINYYFRFLFESGFKIRSIQYFPEKNGNWLVDVESIDFGIQVYSDRNVLNLVLVPAKVPNNEITISLRAMIYYLTDGREFIGDFEGNFAWNKAKQFERLARLLKEYIHEITPYFGAEFERYRSELLQAQKMYNDVLVESHFHKIKR